MPTADFAHALHIGLGRAFLLVKRNYDTSYRDPLLNACFHDFIFDGYVEDSRAPYLFEIIQATNDIDFYREAILTRLSQLPAADGGNDSYQMYNLVACFARQGDIEAREVLLNKFRSIPGFSDFALAKIIIDLDGAEGFCWVLAELGAHLLTQGEEFVVGEDTYEIDDYLVFALEQKIGKIEAAKLIEQLRRENNPPVIAVLDYLDQHSRSAHRQREPDPQLSYSEVKQLLQMQPSRRGLAFYAAWGRQASTDELHQAVEDLIAETNVERLRRYLAIFRNTPFPLNHTFLFDLARHSNRFVAVSAINALENVIHPDVHEFALNNIEHGWMVGRMVTLLKGAYHR
ncbi:MAG TPA: hypothetical protein VHO69_02610, partial [Phototrophicaceae bacterium]|nr:hypothetical protein [Phototrophicaceae bacterium]